MVANMSIDLEAKYNKETDPEKKEKMSQSLIQMSREAEMFDEMAKVAGAYADKTLVELVMEHRKEFQGFGMVKKKEEEKKDGSNEVSDTKPAA